MKLTAVDLSFGIIGDFKVSKSGDIEDTSKDKYQSLRQEIRTRLMGSTGDWGINYPIHTNLRRFIGQRNTPELADELRNRIVAALTDDLFILAGYLKVRVVPISPSNLFVKLTVSVPDLDDGLSEFFIYDTTEHGLALAKG